MKIKNTWMTISLAFAFSFSISGCSLYPEPWTELQMSKGIGGTWYCPEDKDILGANIIIEADIATFTGTWLAEGDRDIDECKDWLYDGCAVTGEEEDLTCFILVEESRLLSADELSEIKELVSSISPPRCYPEFGLACDPAPINSITVDDVTADPGSCCGKLNSAFIDPFRSLRGLLTNHVRDLQ